MDGRTDSIQINLREREYDGSDMMLNWTETNCYLWLMNCTSRFIKDVYVTSLVNIGFGICKFLDAVVTELEWDVFTQATIHREICSHSYCPEFWNKTALLQELKDKCSVQYCNEMHPWHSCSHQYLPQSDNISMCPQAHTCTQG